MRILDFTDQHDLLASAMDRPIADIRALLARQAPPLTRLIAVFDGVGVGTVSARSRPDGRTFLHFACRDRSAYRPLIDAVITRIGGPIHANAQPGTELMMQFEAAGFETEIVVDDFVVPFDRALARLRRAFVPARYRLHRAADLDIDRLVDLDNALRADVPGSDGWQGTRDEMSDDLTDPAAYWVGVHTPSREYVGLVRIWNNPSGPRFGLIGVLRRHRGGYLAAALLRRGLEEAATWGHDTFATGASTSNPMTHAALIRLGLAPVDRSHQMVRR